MVSRNIEEEVAGERSVSLTERLSIFSNNQLIEEVITVWDELIRVEQELVNSRQRLRAMEIEFTSVNSDKLGRSFSLGIEEELRVAKMKIQKLVSSLENAELKIRDNEKNRSDGRVKELQKENTRLLESEEEQILLILDLEEQLDKLISRVKEREN